MILMSHCQRVNFVYLKTVINAHLLQETVLGINAFCNVRLIATIVAVGDPRLLEIT